MSIESDDVEHRYATRVVLSLTTASKDALGVREVVRFLFEPDFVLTDGQTAKLFANPVLRSTYRALKAERSVFAVPELAAAASIETVQHRQFDGGTITVTPADDVPQVYLRIQFDADRLLTSPPTALLLERGELVAKLALASGWDATMREVFLILDAELPEHAHILDLLAAPETTGTVL